MELYGYFRSSAAYRVRIALNLKAIAHDTRSIHLTRGGGEQFAPDYARLNPQRLVPTLIDDGKTLTQSLAIIEYLDETHPTPPLLPSDAPGRARARAIALAIACDIHPLNNLRVLRYLTGEMRLNEDAKNRWYRHWVETGLAQVEAMLAGDPRTGRYCHGDQPTLADIALIPQIANGRRFDCDLSGCPTALRIDAACQALPAFRDAAPANQPDAE
jgi:maleylpyruvate isomerase